MNQRELVTNMAKKPHGHWRMIIKDLKDGYEEQQDGGFTPELISIDKATDNLTALYQFTEYNKSYALYENGATEYVRFEGTVSQLRLKLTIDVFTCYCEPLSDGQDPPF